MTFDILYLFCGLVYVFCSEHRPVAGGGAGGARAPPEIFET